jgi:hypothetical protein
MVVHLSHLVRGIGEGSEPIYGDVEASGKSFKSLSYTSSFIYFKLP